jgi:hypothetical protein
MKYRLLLIISILIIAVGCGGRQEKKPEMGPAETVEAFIRAVTAGEFDEAMSLCDTLTMKEYVDRYAGAWDMLAKKDSSATAIAAGVMADIEFSVEDIVKDDDSRLVTYTVTASGQTKRKTATVKKDEGVWKVEEITDRL